MNFFSELSNSDEYRSFRASVPLKKIAVDADSTKTWKLYDAGPKSVTCPLVCLAPVSGTADVFYKQALYLTSRGIRVISVEGPVYWSVTDWCEGFKRLLDHLEIERVHLFGASLVSKFKCVIGGFLAQKFAEYTFQYSRVESLILCNAFMDTSIFNFNETATMFWLLPGPILKKLVIGNIRSEPLTDPAMAQAAEFILEKVENLSQQELASRLTLNCVNNKVNTVKVRKTKMTIIDVFDESALSTQARESLRSHYTDAKLAHLKTGGNFPYLSRADEVNIYILVHIRQFSDTRHSAQIVTNEDQSTNKKDSRDSQQSTSEEVKKISPESFSDTEAEIGTEAN